MRLLRATLLVAAACSLQLPTRRHIRTTKRYTATVPAAELAEERRTWRRRKRSEVLVFAAPALSTVLADPLMSMFDALVCGRSCSTLEFASLGPALAVFNFVNYGFFFLNAATTVNVAAALARDNKKAATETLSGAVSVAALCGLAVAALVAVWKSNSESGAPDNSSLSHFSAMTLPCWLRRAARNRHRHAIEQASRRWRGGRRDDARTRRKILISTQVDGGPWAARRPADGLRARAHSAEHGLPKGARRRLARRAGVHGRAGRVIGAARLSHALKGRVHGLRVEHRVEIKFYGAFVLNRRVVLHAIDATPARWRGGVGSSPLDGASAATSSPRNDLVSTRHTG